MLGIRDAKDNLLIAAQDAQGLGVTHLSADLAAGAYTVVAAAGFGSGSYQLTTAFAAHDIPACSDVQPLDINGGYIQMLGPAGCRDADGQPMNCTFHAALGRSGAGGHDVERRRRPAAPHGRRGNVLRTDENSYSPNDPMIVEFLPAGTYQLAARAPGARWADITKSICGPRRDRARLLRVQREAGARRHDQRDAELYGLPVHRRDLRRPLRNDLASGATIDVGLNSSDFDAYLVLLDARVTWWTRTTTAAGEPTRESNISRGRNVLRGGQAVQRLLPRGQLRAFAGAVALGTAKNPSADERGSVQ